MKAAVVVLLLLASCIVIEDSVNQTVNETVYAPVKVNTTKPITRNVSVELPARINVTRNKTDIIEVNISLENTSNYTNSTNTDNSTVDSTLPQDLTIGQQYKLIPVLEDLVRNSSCYGLTWIGIENQSDLPLELKKEIKFDYLGGRSFKGWILSVLSLTKKQVASETVEVLIDDKEVICIDVDNFTIDWEPVQRQYDARRFY